MFKVGDIVTGICGHIKNKKYVITNVHRSIVTMEEVKTSNIVTIFDVYIEYDLEFARRLKLEKIKNKIH